MVVNPDESAMATFAKLVGNGVQFFQTSLQDYVTWLHEQRPGWRCRGKHYPRLSDVLSASATSRPLARNGSEFAISHSEMTKTFISERALRW